MKARTILLLGGMAVIAAGAAVVGVPALQKSRQAQTAAAAPVTAQVTTVTAVSSVDSTGAVEPEQSASLSLKTSGTVASVPVKVGDHVKAGDILVTLDPASAPTSVIQAQVDLVTAKTSLNDLLHPTASTIANAEKAVADAKTALTKTQRTLRNAQNPAGQSLYDAVDSAKLALDTASANAQLATVSQSVQDYTNNYWLTDFYWKRYQDLQAKYDANPTPENLTAKNNAYSDYLIKADKQAQLKLTSNTDQANKNASVTSAQKDYNTAVANLNGALKGPDATKVAQAQADNTVAQTNLADAQDTLNHLKNGAKPEDLQAAQVRVQVAQATIDSLTLRAPFDGDVLAVNYKPGDPASPSATAITLADRSRLHVSVSVDETAIGAIASGNPVSLTLDALPGVALTGTVNSVEPFGQTVSGLVRYSVRVDLTKLDPRLLLYMTANATIQTSVQQNALAVPLAAIQYDNQGEFVNRVSAASKLERVNVVSGQTINDVVVVKGELKPGDNVQVIATKTTTASGGFGG